LKKFLSLTEEKKIFPSKERLQKALSQKIDQIKDENFEVTSNCIELLLNEDWKSPGKVHFMRKSQEVTKEKKKLAETFMKKFSIGPYKCLQVFEDDSPFSKNYELMKNLLELGKTEDFKKYLDDYIKQKKLLLKCPQQIEQFNIAAKEYDSIVKSSNSRKIIEIKSCKFDEESSRFLEIATGKKYDDVVEFLLVKLPETQVISSMEIACKSGLHNILKMLLIKVKSFNEIEGLCLLHKVCESLYFTQDKRNSQQNFQECFKALIQRFPQLANEKDKDKNTPLHFAVKSRSNTNETVMLLEKGSFLGAKNKNKQLPIDEISRKCLESYLDSCASFTSHDRELELDLRFLTFESGQMCSNESHLLHKIQENDETKPLIAHPVVSCFINLKWWKLRFFILLNFVIELLFITTLSAYIFSRRYASDSRENVLKVASKISFLMVVVIVLLCETLKISFLAKNYFKKFENIFEIPFVAVAVLTIFEVLPFSNHFLLFVFMISSFKFFKSFGTLPYLKVSIYVAMLQKVTMTFLKSFAIFFTIPLGFAFSFNLVFYISNLQSDESLSQWTVENSSSTDEEAFHSFQHPLLAVVKTLSMMTGEFGEKLKFRFVQNLLMFLFQTYPT
jgi:hypothetical protein